MQSRSRSKEQISDEKLRFFEKSPKEASEQQKSGYTREYSYNIDSDTLRHSGQSDPRGLGFSYEKNNAPATQPSKTAPQKHHGTALAFTYNPQKSSKTDLASEKIRTQQKEIQTSRVVESSYSDRRAGQPQRILYDEKSPQTRAKSPGIKGEAVQSNIDESSEISSTSQESMVNEYAKESMRQKTSALIAGSTVNTPPTIAKTNLYKTPPASFTSQSPASKLTPRPTLNDSEQYSRYGLASSTKSPSKSQQRSLWGQDEESTQPSTTRLPVLSPSEAAGVERKYTHLSRKRMVKNADGSYEETEETIDPDSIDPKRKFIGSKLPSSMVKSFLFDTYISHPNHLENSSVLISN